MLVSFFFWLVLNYKMLFELCCFNVEKNGIVDKCFWVDVVCVSNVLEYVREVLKCWRFDC